MIHAPLLILFLLLSHSYSDQNNCGCKSVSDSEKTHPGHGFVIADRDERPVKSFRGTVIYSEDVYSEEVPVGETLVEVFDHPELILKTPADAELARKIQRRVAACKTGENSKFCFDNLPAGKYKLLCSKPGFEPTYVIINYDPKGDHSFKQEIKLEITIR